MTDEQAYCECCSDHPATVTRQGIRICADCQRGFDGEADRLLGAAVRQAVRDKTVWKDGQFHSWLDWADTCIALGAAVATALEAEKERQHG